ncbi:MAG: hypothetical protein IJP46_09325 [Prevotella sp.]|nr:hypothetical protein [Prevotella sp.]
MINKLYNTVSVARITTTLILALLCTMVQGAWADDISIIEDGRTYDVTEDMTVTERITANDNISTIELNIDGETTNINANVNPNANSGWYTLDGCRLNGKPTTSGIYVNNGRKVVIK